MTYKSILVHVGAAEGGLAAVPAAMSVGARCGAALIGLGAAACEEAVDPLVGGAQAGVVDLLLEDVDAEIARAEAGFRALCKDYPFPLIWRRSLDYPTRALLDASCAADLIVAVRPHKGADLRRHLDIADTVLGSGLPVLLVPDGQQTAPLGTVLLGWTNTRETRRAVSAALPLMKAAAQVVITQICRPDEAQEAEPCLELVTRRLERHGVRATWRTYAREGVEPDEDLERVARAVDADVAVLGAYGHSRIGEWAWGGTTRDVLADFPIPVLLSH